MMARKLFVYWDEEGSTVYVRAGSPTGSPVGLRDFSEANIGKEWVQEPLDIDKKIQELENVMTEKYSSFFEEPIDDIFDWEFVSDLYMAYAEEIYLDGASFLREHLSDAEVISENHPFKGSSIEKEEEKIYEFFRAGEDRYYEETLTRPFFDKRETIEKILKLQDIDYDMLRTLLERNKETDGSVHVAIFEEINRLLLKCEGICEEEDEHEELFDLIGRLFASHYRHTQTNYDTIDKRGLTDDEVARLRREFNPVGMKGFGTI